MNVKQLVKAITQKLGVEVCKNENKIISLKPETKPKGNVLLSYTINPFLLKNGELFNNAHTCDWECCHIAKTFLKLRYCVDVIKYDNHKFIPKKDYSFFIDELTNMERIAPLLNKDCVKILHCVWAHWLFNNTAQYQRHLGLRKRRGVALKPRRLLKPNLGIEYSDYATILGNKFTINTYDYAQKPIYRIPISTQVLHPWPKDKDFENCKNHFLWFGSSGLVHKGLDLVLEAFAGMTDYHLYICGPVQKEKDFEKVYYKELYEAPNIHTVGWVDVGGPEFLEITSKCIGLIYPSCSEGQSGTVVTCLHAGLIPILSYESGVDVHDFGVILKDCSIEEIKNSIRMVSGRSIEELKRMSRKAREFARANHTREKFAEEYRNVIDKIISAHSKG